MPNTHHTLDVDESRTLNVGELPDFISRQVYEAQRYYFDLVGPKNARIHVALGGMERVRPDYAIQRSGFSYFSIEFVAEGKGRIKLAGKDFDLLPGSVFGYGPSSPLEIVADPEELMTKYYVTFSGCSAKKMLDIAGFEQCGVRHMHSIRQVRDIFEMLQTNGLNHSRFSQQLCASLIPTLVYKIAEQAIAPGTTYSRAFSTYLKLCDLIDQHFMDLKNVKQVAARCRLTEHYICELFKRFNHVTPYKYLLRLRMQHAADLLSNPRVLVKQVSRRLEFADQFQFSRAFKRVFGISPAQWQQEVAHAPSAK